MTIVERREQSDLIRALGAVLDEPSPGLGGIAGALELGPVPEAAEFTDVFLLNLYPYASVHLGDEGMLGGEARDRVAGFWRAVGLTPPAEPDHLGALLGLWAALEERASVAEEEASPSGTPASGPGGEQDAEARAAMAREAAGALLWEHLLPWAPVYAARLAEFDDGFYGRWAGILLDLLAERMPGDPGERLPVHLQVAGGLDDPRQGEDRSGERLLDQLLAPVRSGMVLTRADLARAGRELELGLRMGERKYTLKALLGQDPAAILGWLAREARAWEARHEEQIGAFGPIARFWRDRAGRAATLLEELSKSEAATVGPEPRQAPASTMEEGHVGD